jgi:hypothetical protein
MPVALPSKTARGGRSLADIAHTKRTSARALPDFFDEFGFLMTFREEAHGVFSFRLYQADACRSIVNEVSGLDGWRPAQVVDARDGVSRLEMDPDARSASILAPPYAREVFKQFEDKLAELVRPLVTTIWGVDLPNHAGTHIVRYEAGGHYLPHKDSGPGVEHRYFTVVCYLNDDFEGGATGFPSLGYWVFPQAGNAILFPADYTHCARPVTSGEKYVFVSWVVGLRPIRWI